MIISSVIQPSHAGDDGFQGTELVQTLGTAPLDGQIAAGVAWGSQSSGTGVRQALDNAQVWLLPAFGHRDPEVFIDELGNT